MLSRTHDTRKSTPEQDGAFHDASVTHARAACKLDAEEGESWYTLGNAHLRRYFSQGRSGRNSVDLLMAMKVFEKAETCYAKMARPSTTLQGQWGNPDLRLSRGLARRHVEDYQGAIDDFRAAHALDPSLNAGDMAEDLNRWVKGSRTWERTRLKPKQRRNRGEALHRRSPRLQEHGALN